VLLAALIAPPRAAVATLGQSTSTYYLPNAQRGADRLLGAVPAADRRDAIVGFGETTIEVRNFTAQAANLDLTFKQVEQVSNVRRRLPARAADAILLKDEPAVGLGNHSVRIASDAPLAVAARTTWEGGASVAYEAAEAANELVLPLAARNVLSHTTNFYVQNTSTDDEDVTATVEIYSDENGSLLKQIDVRLGPLGSVEYDLYFDVPFFGDLPVNAADGFLGAIRLRSEAPLVALAYGDELAGGGAAAYPARPLAKAHRIQYLPLVRANYLGDSLIGITSRENAPITVVVTYHGAPDSPSGANQTFTQTIQLTARGSAYIDLSGRGRGTRPAPALPRGSGTNRGFYGGAVIEAGGRILATVLESAIDDATVRTSAAYHAYSPGDLGTRFGVARIQGTGGIKTLLVAQNPGTDPVTINPTYDEGGRPFSGASLVVPPGEMRVIPPDSRAAGKSVSLAADGALAMLAYDTGVAAPADWGRWGVDTTAYWPARSPDGIPTTGAEPPTWTPVPSTATRTRTPSATPSPTATSVVTPTPTASPTATRPTPTVADPDRKIYLPSGYREFPARP